MPSDSTPLLHDLTVALLKVAGIVVVLALIYPLVVTAIANSLK
ncbi:MAG: hypothetical protein ABSH03_19335 [Candidatus Lustribacter sp.]|jgi:K+-transporting ATPase c subunit